MFDGKSSNLLRLDWFESPMNFFQQCLWFLFFVIKFLYKNSSPFQITDVISYLITNQLKKEKLQVPSSELITPENNCTNYTIISIWGSAHSPRFHLDGLYFIIISLFCFFSLFLNAPTNSAEKTSKMNN
jgi:hypothetical protein